MTHQHLAPRLAALTTPHLADACVRAGATVRCGPAGLTAAIPGSRMWGPVIPVRHVGSVDIYLEALTGAAPGSVLVVDNGGRLEEACVGDLVALEVREAGLAGIVIWGLHRDTVDLTAIGLPVVSLGAMPTGPLSVGTRPEHALTSARVGELVVTAADVVVTDEDGVLFLPADRLEELIGIAEGIRDTERRQAERIAAGTSLREQVQFDRYLADREIEPGLRFRDHLRRVGGEIEV